MKKIRKYFTNIKYGIRIIFNASPKYFVLRVIISMVFSALSYFPLFIFRNLINALVNYETEHVFQITTDIFLYTALYCVILLIQHLMETAASLISFKYNDAISYYLDNLMLNKVSDIDLAFFDSSNLNDKLVNSWRLVNSTQNMVWMLFDLLQSIVNMIIAVSLISTLNIWLIPAVIIGCIPSILGDAKINKKDYQFEKEQAKTYRKLGYYKNLFFGESRNEIVIFKLKNYFIQLYKKQWKRWDADRVKKDTRDCIFASISLISLTLIEIITYIVSTLKLITRDILVGDVTYYVSLLTQFRNSFTDLCYKVNIFDRTSNEISDVRTFIELKPMVEKSGILVPGNNPKIEFKNVSFKYPNSENYVLHKCSFIINPGEIVGLVGLNGSGKSTIVKLLCRFYDPCEGCILINDISNTEYDIIKLRALFGVLFQDFVKYSFTARENIAMSDILRMNDDVAILDACKKSQILEIIDKWENGLDENLTKRFDKSGKELSGGQWQRLALARAFFRNGSIILLDEPSAALDPIAEHDIFKSFSTLSSNRSTVLISHRLSSITLANKILVLEDGHIVEQGSHFELLNKNGRYAYLFNLQASKYK